MPKPSTSPFEITKVNSGGLRLETDLLVGEEPLETQLGFGKAQNRKKISLSVTMRTEGNDFELAIGFLFTEGVITSASDIKTIRYCTDVKSEEERENVIIVELEEEVVFDQKKLERHFYTSSSCGVCGKTSIEAVATLRCDAFEISDHRIDKNFIQQLPEIIRKSQTIFKHTGGIHAAALFDPAGKMICMREDVGRHNAVDKVVGAMLQKGMLPLKDHLILVSGRAGFELVQKSIAAGIPTLAAIGAPSSLSVKLALNYNMTLLGFVRDKRFNIYSAPERIS